MTVPPDHGNAAPPTAKDARHDASAYGSYVANDYDDLYEGVFATEDAVELLVDLAEGGPVLEFGIGTGRRALPLADRGLRVVGVDGSAEMLGLLAAKPRAERIRTVQGDFAEVDAGGHSRWWRSRSTPFRLARSGRAGRLFPQRRPPPGTGRSLHG